MINSVNLIKEIKRKRLIFNFLNPTRNLVDISEFIFIDVLDKIVHKRKIMSEIYHWLFLSFLPSI